MTASLESIIKYDLCIGCGLCESLSDSRALMGMTPQGSLRPLISELNQQEQNRLEQVCPACHTAARIDPLALSTDQVWGHYYGMGIAWAADDAIRYRAATGGALTALAAHALRSKSVEFVMHVAADPERPMRSMWFFSTSVKQVIERCGSRYGPVSPLAGFEQALQRNQPFAIVAKPCDLSAVHNLSIVDERVDQLCVLRLALVCGGQSRLSKSTALLKEFDVQESELKEFRYRGYGNPGDTVVTTTDDRQFSKTYLDLWEDQTGWEIETRCKICTDALGETADVVAADVWPGGAPVGDDAGFNGLIVRTSVGLQCVNSAFQAGALIRGDAISPRQFDDFQPHQVAKKNAVQARFLGLQDAGGPSCKAVDLRIEEQSYAADTAEFQQQRDGACGRFTQLSKRDTSAS